ncbi:rhomboid family intramembrane serine protease [Kitasatospora sp. MMS16-BH015]|uniref:rhomboid family intramembrane serine protease n=1 Tax=Kitasatospora sp. MMS16-BH015 TaxID=2018025 RepID=UPI000CA3E736|nr:rhomboid family intramembrane serine protease [Kitasatospora sp. MMS16-BH015]AUG78354.1 rhomboid family intramembrane serine protease [Kitasatospora sp. MMS16-BH015]
MVMRESSSTGPDELPAKMIAEARRAFFVMFALLCAVWAVQVANWADDYDLTRQYGIVAHQPGRLVDVFAAPFLHLNWQHLEGNSGPLFVFGFLAAHRGVKRFLGLTLLVALTSGAAVWLFERDDVVTVGASGVIYGYFGYVVLRGLFDRNLIDSLIGLVMGASFAYILTTAVPGTPEVSWLGHLGGLAGGLVGAWVFRDRSDRRNRSNRSDRRKQGEQDARSEPDPQPTTPNQSKGPKTADGDRAALLKELDDLGL